jgi:U4/U6.U5 tri-snRNP component SNU23
MQILTQKDEDYGRKIWKVKESESTSVQMSEDKKQELRFLESRKEDLDLESKIGRKMMSVKDAPLQEQMGFYCEVCDALMKDSSSYLDHINGKKHNKLKGNQELY